MRRRHFAGWTARSLKLADREDVIVVGISQSECSFVAHHSKCPRSAGSAVGSRGGSASSARIPTAHATGRACAGWAARRRGVGDGCSPFASQTCEYEGVVPTDSHGSHCSDAAAHARSGKLTVLVNGANSGGGGAGLRHLTPRAVADALESPWTCQDPSPVPSMQPRPIADWRPTRCPSAAPSCPSSLRPKPNTVDATSTPQFTERVVRSAAARAAATAISAVEFSGEPGHRGAAAAADASVSPISVCPDTALSMIEV